MFAGKAQGLRQRGKASTQVGSGKIFAKDEHSSLSGPFVSDVDEKIYHIGPRTVRMASPA